MFFKASLFFNSASLLINFFMNSVSDVVYVLLIAHNHHHTEKHSIFSLFLTMSWPSSISFMSDLCNLFFIFTLIFTNINPIISLKQVHLFFARFLEYLKLVLDDNIDDKSE